MSELSATRRDVYSCLSICFDYPTSIVEVDSVGPIAEALDSLSRPGAEEGVAGEGLPFGRLLNGANQTSGNDLLDLQVEYSRLFLGPFKPVLYPYESIFLGRNHEEAADVQRVDHIFRREGLALSPQFKDLPDHISVDFEFMSYLCSKEIEADESQDATAFFAYRLRQQSFLENHIINWVPAFAERLEQVAQIEFYRELANFTRRFVRWDHDRFEAFQSEEAEWQLCQQ
jgi:TorA maturation chaperone TorD